MDGFESGHLMSCYDAASFWHCAHIQSVNEGVIPITDTCFFGL